MQDAEADDGEPDPNFRHDADAHASHAADADQPTPPKHTDDAHAGR